MATSNVDGSPPKVETINVDGSLLKVEARQLTVQPHLPEANKTILFSAFLLLSSLELSDTKVYALKYEPSLEPLHISAK